jgi:hypothetical protein
MVFVSGIGSDKEQDGNKQKKAKNKKIMKNNTCFKRKKSLKRADWTFAFLEREKCCRGKKSSRQEEKSNHTPYTTLKSVSGQQKPINLLQGRLQYLSDSNKLEICRKSG